MAMAQAPPPEGPPAGGPPPDGPPGAPAAPFALPPLPADSPRPSPDPRNLEGTWFGDNYLDSSDREWEDGGVSPFLMMPRPHSNSHVDRCGDFLSLRTQWSDDQAIWEPMLDEAFDVLDAWRNLHAQPLAAVANRLERRALAIDPHAVFSQRLKRFRSIRLKLMNEPAMALTQMQDMAGCRVVLNTIEQVYALKALYDLFSKEHPGKGSELIPRWTKDYIRNPKSDGYRSVHLVMKYRTAQSDFLHCNGLRVEIQIRSRLQHAWAMAVETASAVTNQALKSGVGQDNWKRFFKLMGDFIAMQEDSPLLAADEGERSDLKIEATQLASQLRVIPLLEGMSHVLESFQSSGGDELYLLTLNSQQRKMQYRGFKQSDFPLATQAYAQEERQYREDADVHVVLVAVRSINELKAAYPSYFLDSGKFIAVVRQLYG